MMKSVDLKNLTEERAFQIRLQAYLRINAIKISSFYEDKEKFKKYIEERERKIVELTGESGSFNVIDHGKLIYP